KGDILLKSVFEVMPFENEVIIVKMKGSDLQGLFDYYAEHQVNNPVSHLYIETNNGQLTKTLINGKTVNPEQDYYIATSDYLALGGDNMKFFS
ncbi:bifunctional NAD pyrophosphatase/5'-nucleotidase, partial [Chryseobacterium mucoviscidosis]